MYKLQQIPICSSIITFKLPNIIRLYSENVNLLNSNLKEGKYYYKYRCMRYIFKYLDLDLIFLIETQVNPLLLDKTYDILNNILSSGLSSHVMSNNSRELIRRRQQGGVFISIRGEYSNLVTLSLQDSS